jgi:hypothetical protein
VILTIVGFALIAVALVLFFADRWPLGWVGLLVANGVFFVAEILRDTAVSLTFAAVNAAFVLAGAVALFRSRRSGA